MKIPVGVEEWEKAMKGSNAGKMVLDNIKLEENVPESIRKQFFEKLRKTYQKGESPLNPGFPYNSCASNANLIV